MKEKIKPFFFSRKLVGKLHENQEQNEIFSTIKHPQFSKTREYKGQPYIFLSIFRSYFFFFFFLVFKVERNP